MGRRPARWYVFYELLKAGRRISIIPYILQLPLLQE